MKELVYKLLKSFYEITKKNKKTGKTALGLAITLEAGFEGSNLRNSSGSYTKSSPLLTEIADAFRDMVHQGWIEETTINDSRKGDYYRDFKDYFGKCDLTYTINTEDMLKQLRHFEWPFADNWFFLLEKGENLIKNEYYNIYDEEFNYKGKKKNKKLYKCFVIMPIGKVDTIEYKNNMDVYKKIIKPCVENCSYNIKCYHADLISETGDISRQVFEALYNDNIVIADLRRNNPNVIYELGIRHTFGKRSILICSDIIQNYFHTTKYRAIKYNIDGNSNKEFYQKLAKQIEDIIEHPQKSDNPVTDTLHHWKTYLDKHFNQKKGKRLYLSRVNTFNYSFGEIKNISDKDLIDIKITLEYIHKYDGLTKREAEVIDNINDPVRAPRRTCNLIGKENTLYIADFPKTKTKVNIQGKDADTEEIFNEDYEID